MLRLPPLTSPQHYPARLLCYSTMKESFKDPNVKAALTLYHPNAIRNRLPVEFKNSAIPHVRFCHPRNKHTYE